jgi:hypothetical protein
VRPFQCFCGTPKSEQRSLCDDCWKRLPAQMRADFHEAFFSVAYPAAVEWLKSARGIV